METEIRLERFQAQLSSTQMGNPGLNVIGIRIPIIPRYPLNTKPHFLGRAGCALVNSRTRATADPFLLPAGPPTEGQHGDEGKPHGARLRDHCQLQFEHDIERAVRAQGPGADAVVVRDARAREPQAWVTVDEQPWLRLIERTDLEERTPDLSVGEVSRDLHVGAASHKRLAEKKISVLFEDHRGVGPVEQRGSEDRVRDPQDVHEVVQGVECVEGHFRGIDLRGQCGVDLDDDGLGPLSKLDVKPGIDALHRSEYGVCVETANVGRAGTRLRDIVDLDVPREVLIRHAKLIPFAYRDDPERAEVEEGRTVGGVVRRDHAVDEGVRVQGEEFGVHRTEGDAPCPNPDGIQVERVGKPRRRDWDGERLGGGETGSHREIIIEEGLVDRLSVGGVRRAGQNDRHRDQQIGDLIAHGLASVARRRVTGEGELSTFILVLLSAHIADRTFDSRKACAGSLESCLFHRLGPWSPLNHGHPPKKVSYRWTLVREWEHGARSLRIEWTVSTSAR